MKDLSPTLNEKPCNLLPGPFVDGIDEGFARYEVDRFPQDEFVWTH
ncbi:MAG: hypothetical protein JRF64_11105 [Deltaproteobacteria bacterium]|nr:hypothetical protein [Deltaproteobacteria bacterium]